MRILIANDDGIHAPGIALLARAAARLGEVWVVAPDTERSGVSHAITLYRPLRLREFRPRWYACDGTPTDCVYLAINQMKLAPDLVLSGINAGPNLAHDVLYSGTVAAALEGAHWGVPSIAISHCSSNEALLGRLDGVIADVLDALMPVALKVGRALNVNLPPATRLPYKGVRSGVLGHRVYSNEVHEREDPRGHLYYWIGGAEVHMPDIAGSDCNLVRDNFISVTPLGDDLTLRAKLPAITDGLLRHADTPLGVDAPVVDEGQPPHGFPFE